MTNGDGQAIGNPGPDFDDADDRVAVGNPGPALDPEVEINRERAIGKLGPGRGFREEFDYDKQ